MKNGFEAPKGTAFFLLTRYMALSEEAFTRAREFIPERRVVIEIIGDAHHHACLGLAFRTRSLPPPRACRVLLEALPPIVWVAAYRVTSRRGTNIP